MKLEESIKTWERFWDRSTAAEPYMVSEGEMAEKWNQRSATFGRGRDQQARKRLTDDVINFLEQSGVRIKGAKVLDIGCGNGALALPLARLGAEVTAFDISVGMLSQLDKIALQEGLAVRTVEGSWWSADIDALGFRSEFDLVMAARNPSMRNVDCLERMMACSQGHCFYIGFIDKNENSTYREISRVVFKENYSRNPPNIFHPFMHLYLSGHRPEIRINYHEMTEELPWEQAAESAIDFFSDGRELTTEAMDQVRDYVRSAAIEGTFSSTRKLGEGLMLRKIA